MRSEIRGYIADALTALAPHVYRSRGYAVNGSELPFIVVYTPEESSETVAIASGNVMRTLHRSVRVVIEYVIAATSDVVEDLMDEKASEIETILFADEKLGGLAFTLDLKNTETLVSTDDETDKPLGMIRLTFDVMYRHAIERVT